MKKIVMLVALFAAVPAGAQQATSPLAAPEATTQVKPEKKVCRLVEETGSNLARRRCFTKADWNALDREQAKITERDTEHMREKQRSSLPGEE
jgi:protein subunit release factor B